MSDFHTVVFFNDYYTLIVAFLTKQIQNRYRYRRLPDSPDETGANLWLRCHIFVVKCAGKCDN